MPGFVVYIKTALAQFPAGQSAAFYTHHTDEKKSPDISLQLLLLRVKSHSFTLTNGYSLYLVNSTLEIFIQNTEDVQVHFYRKSARGTLFFWGVASTFAMFLHSVPPREAVRYVRLPLQYIITN